MKEITQEQFDALLLAHPQYTEHTIGFCTPPVTFFWKSPSQGFEDRSFGKNAFLMIQHDFDLKTGEKLPDRFYSLEGSAQ